MPNINLVETARMRHAYWGLRYSTEQCIAALDDSGLQYTRLEPDKLVGTVSRLLADNLIVGWFHGAAEIGPRALGARSMLADPRKRSNLVRLNKIKSREEWRPLAPSVLEDHFDEYFRTPVRSPFMNVACQVQEAVRHRIPAVVHVDGSARPQVVREADAPRYWSLIESFRRLTGVPVLLNTSFNLRNEPIVNSPRDAIRDFLFSPLDALVLEDCLVIKSERP
jgi:carbamoyltransferase